MMSNKSSRDEEIALAYGLVIVLVVIGGLLIYLWVT
jgi:hypothetical protein